MIQVTARVARAFTVVKPQTAYRLRPTLVPVSESQPRTESFVQMRKLKYHVNASVDGYLLNEGLGFDAFSQDEDPARYLDSLHAYGIVLMGRNTYEASLKAGVADPYPHLMSYVFTRTLRQSAGSAVEMVSGDATEWVRRLKACPGKDLYLCGGAQLAASLFRAGLIDEVVVKLSPVLQGTGRRLAELGGEIALVCESGVAHDDGAVVLTYRVRNGEARQATVP